MRDIDLGKVTWTAKGAWNSTTTFEYVDIVRDGYGLFISLQDGNRNHPTSDTNYWFKLYDFTQMVTDITNAVMTALPTILDVEDVENIISREVGDKYLSKLRDDIANGYITFKKGLQIGETFVSGLLGQGGVFNKNNDGTTHIEADTLYIRMKAYFDTVEIRKFIHSGGNRIASVAGGKCIRVERIDANGDVTTVPADTVLFRCYFRANDGETACTNDFQVGDQAYCKITSAQSNTSLYQHNFWRMVVGRNVEGTLTEDGEYWIDLSNREHETLNGVTYSGYLSGSDAPLPQDDIIQLGNKNDSTRQGAIIEYVSGNNSPSYQIYQGINDFSFEGKNYIDLGYSTQNGRAYINVFGDAFIGDKGSNPASYIRYNSQAHTLDIKGRISAMSTISGQTIDEYIESHSSDWTEEEINAMIHAVTDDIQAQIDGELDTWYYPGVPTLNNVPASGWTTDDEKREHVGDLYYDKDTGYVYRFVYDDENETFYWTQIHDDAISEALRIANDAQDTADSKRRVFICDSTHQTPAPPYDEGDLWVNVKYPWATGATYNDEILKCINPKTSSGSFDIEDWSLANGYTARLANFVNNTYAPFVQDISNQVDKKAETWRQNTDPSLAQGWVASSHIGDIWMDTSSNGGNKTYIYQNTGTDANPNYQWVAQEVPTEVFDKIDGKAAIYVEWNAWIVSNVNQLQDKDLFIPAADVTPTGSSTTYKANKVYRWDATNSTWTEIDYTDNTALNNFINGVYADTLAALVRQLDKKAQTWYQSTDPSTDWYDSSSTPVLDVRNEHVGDLWYNTTNDTTWYYNKTTSGGTTTYEWKQQNVPVAVFDKIDGKADIFVEKPTTYNVNDMWVIENDTISCPDTDVPANCKRGDIVIANTKRTNSYNKDDWAKKDRYTDDSAFEGYISAFLNKQSYSSGDSAVAATIQNAIAGALGSGTVVDGGLLLTSLIGMRKNTGTAQNPNYVTWGGISGQYDDWTGTTHAKGHGIAAWYGGAMVDKEDVQVLPASYAKSLFRFDGSGYLASGNITWDDSGNLTVQGQTIKASTYYLNGTDITATLNAILSMFTLEGAGTTASPYVIKANFDLYSVGGITALGQGSQGGGGGASALYQLTDVWPDDATNPTKVRGAQPGYVLTFGNDNHWYAAPTAETYVLPQATTSALGGIIVSNALGSQVTLTSGAGTTANRYYGVQIDSVGQAFVNIPWTDTVYTLPVASSAALGGIMIGYNGTTPKTYAVQLDASNKAYVAVNWDDAPTDYWHTGDSRTANTVLAAPNGSNGAATFRALVAADIPNLGAGKITSGTFDAARIPDLSGTYAAVSRVSTLEGYFNASGYALYAAQLGTAHSLWGNSFNGSADITSSIIISTPKTGETDKYIKIGDIYIGYDATNDAIEVYKLNSSNNHVAADFYARGGVSALGAGSSGGGGGGQGDVTWDLLAANDPRQINLSHLTDALTLALFDYATHTWVQQQGYVTSSGVTYVATGTGLTGGTITSTGTISINSTYQTYISHGESAYNSLSSYLPLSGGTMSGTIKWRNARTGIYNLGTTDTTPSGYIVDYQGGNTVMGLISWDGANDEGGILVGSDNCTIYNSSDSGSVLKVMDKDVSGDLTGDYTAGNCFLWVGSDGTTRAKELYEGTYRVITSNTIGSQSVNYASSAGSVDWNNVSGHPTAVSSFTNDSGYITSGGSCAYATSAGTATDNTKVLKAGDTMSGGLALNCTGHVCLDFRPDSPSWGSRMEMMGAGNDAIVWSVAQSVTSFMFFNGVTLTDRNDWNLLGTPSMQIKANSVYINQLIDNGVSPSYRLYVNGDIGTSGAIYRASRSAYDGTIAIGYDGNGDSGIYYEGSAGNSSSDNWFRIGSRSSIFITADINTTYSPTSIGSFILIQRNGNVGIAASSPAYKLDVNGSINGTSVYYNGNACIHAGNIGSQSVAYATSAGSATSATNNVEKLAWWSESDLHNVDNLVSGVTFAYSTHNAPTSGVIASLTGTHESYQLQLQGQYYGENLYFRNMNGDNGTWNPWRYVIHSGNIGSQSVASATNATYAAYATYDSSGNTISSTYLPLSAGTSYPLTGKLVMTTSLTGAPDADTYPNTNALLDISGGGGDGFFIGQYANSNIWLQASYRNTTTNPYKLILNPLGGNVGVGLSDPSYPLAVKGSISSTNPYGNTWQSVNLVTHADIGLQMISAGQWMHISGTGSSMFIYNGSWDNTGTGTYTQGITITSSNYIGIGNGNPTVKLDVGGIIQSSSSLRRAAKSVYQGDLIIGDAGLGDDGIFYNSSNNSWFRLQSQSSIMLSATQGTSATATRYDLFINYGDGYVGIGTSSPDSKLHVNGTAHVSSLQISQAGGIYVESSGGGIRKIYGCDSSDSAYARMAAYAILPDNDYNDAWQVRPYDGGYDDAIIHVTQSKNVGICTTSPSYKLHVSGDIYATGGVTCASDARMKDVVSPTDLRVEQVADAPSVKFLWKDKHELGMQVGTIAQYWQKVLPEAVSDKSGELSLSYGVAAIVAVITTAKKVVDHEKRISELEKECKRLKTENEQLKMMIA